jgi:hypothetical protein
LKSLSVRCEQGSKGGPGLDVWLSRGAMIGFVGAVGVELTTGKGVLQVTARPPSSGISCLCSLDGEIGTSALCRTWG